MPETHTQPSPEQPKPVQEARVESGQLAPDLQPERATPTVDREAAQPSAMHVAPVTPVAPTTPAHAEFRHQVEATLSDGLAETYKSLDPVTQQKFKVAGEQTAAKISVLLQSTKVQTKKILDLIVAWLRIIPGVNKFFLEQEAKIKADKLLALRKPPSV